MASIDKPGLEPEKEAPPLETTAPDVEKAAPPPPPESKPPGDAPPPTDYFVVVDLVLRLFLFAAAVVAVVVMVTAKETELVGQVPIPPYLVYRQAKFNHSPAFIYFVVALSVAGLYSIITAAVSFLAILKPGSSTKLLLAHFIIFDVLLLGIVAAATGAAGGVAYIGLKGNSHVGWIKICNVYDKYCQYIGASIALSLVASIVLVFLVILSVFSLSKKIPK